MSMTPEMVLPEPQNMGMMDRIIRSALGGMLMTIAFGRPAGSISRKLSMGVGGAFLIYGFTGVDPLLRLMNATSYPNDLKSMKNKMKMRTMPKITEASKDYMQQAAGFQELAAS